MTEYGGKKWFLRLNTTCETINGINLGGSDFPHAYSGVVYRPSVSRYGDILLVFFILVYIDIQMQLTLLNSQSGEIVYSSNYLVNRSPYTILGLGFEVVSPIGTVVWQWDIA